MSIKNVLNEDGQKELRREFGRNEIFKQAVDTEGFVKDPWISEELGKSLAELESCLIR
jgi:hypothetical protein